MINLGDMRLGDDFSFMFTTYGQTGSPKDLDSSMSLACYKGVNGSTAATTSPMLSGFNQPVIHDGRPGLYRVDVDMDEGTSEVNFFLAGHDYFFVARAGTVDNVSLNGVCIATFSVANRLMKPFPGIDGEVGDTRTTTAFEAEDVPPAALDFYQHQALLWTSGAMKGLSTFITGSSTDDPVELTVQTMPATPAYEDTFIILGTKGS